MGITTVARHGARKGNTWSWYPHFLRFIKYANFMLCYFSVEVTDVFHEAPNDADSYLYLHLSFERRSFPGDMLCTKLSSQKYCSFPFNSINLSLPRSLWYGDFSAGFADSTTVCACWKLLWGWWKVLLSLMTQFHPNIHWTCRVIAMS